MSGNMESNNIPVDFTVGEVFEEAWEAVSKNIGSVVGLTLVVMGMSAVMGSIPFLGIFFSSLLSAGYLLSLMRLRDGHDLSFGALFWAFQDLNRAIQVVMGYIVFIFSFGLGCVLFIIPGIFIACSWTFYLMPIILNGETFVAGIKKSYELTSGHRLKIFWFFFLSVLLCLLGLLFFGIGFLVTAPLTTVAYGIFYEKLAGRSDWLLVETDTVVKTFKSEVVPRPEPLGD